MIDIRIENIDGSAIQSLIDNQVRESKTIEYKEQLPGTKDDDKKEFLADVSSFANASGGDIVFGVSECRDENAKTTGIPDAAVGLEGVNLDQEIRRIENMIRDGIEPRIQGIRTQVVEGFPKGPILVLRIPQSWASPHMVSFKASPRFFSRNNAGKAPLDVAEIRSAFLQSEAIPERIRRFREERLGKIVAGENPEGLSAQRYLVLHVVPVGSLAGQYSVDPTRLLDGSQSIQPIGATGFSRRLNLDGFLSYTGRDSECHGYCQVFRNGVFEFVDTKSFGRNQEIGLFLPSELYERRIIHAATACMTVLQSLDIETPVLVMLSLIGVKGMRLGVDSWRFDFDGLRPLEQQHLILPEVSINDFSCDISASLRPLFDLVWQSFGLRRSYNFNETGHWAPRR